MACHFRKWHKCDLSRCPLCRRSRSISGRNLDTAESTRMTRSRPSAPLIRSSRRMPIANQRDAIAKTCRSKRAYSFLICARALSNSVLRVVLYREHASCLSVVTRPAKILVMVAPSGPLPTRHMALRNKSVEQMADTIPFNDAITDSCSSPVPPLLCGRSRCRPPGTVPCRSRSRLRCLSECPA
jgi:hypothetical protein